MTPFLAQRAPTLPQEIIDMIIGHLLPSDGDALRNCNLTCRAWVHASRSQNFKFVTVNHVHDLRFCFDISQQSPSIAKYIRNIVLDYEADDYEKTPTPLKFTAEELRMLASIVVQIVRLDYFGIYGSLDKVYWPDAAAFRLPRITSVLKLDISDIQFPDMESLTALFGSLPNVQSVTAKALWIGTRDDDLMDSTPSIEPIMPNLNILDVQYINRSGPFQLLFSSHAQEVHVELDSDEDIAHFCPIFLDSTAATSVCDMAIAIANFNIVPDPETLATVLKECANLRRIDLSQKEDTKDPGKVFRWVATMLLSVPSSLITITLGCSWDDIASIEQLATTLNCTQFPDLEGVFLFKEGPAWSRSYLAKPISTGAELRRIFADLHKKGILTINEHKKGILTINEHKKGILTINE